MKISIRQAFLNWYSVMKTKYNLPEEDVYSIWLDGYSMAYVLMEEEAGDLE